MSSSCLLEKLAIGFTLDVFCSVHFLALQEKMINLLVGRTEGCLTDSHLVPLRGLTPEPMIFKFIPEEKALGLGFEKAKIIEFI